MRNLSRHKMIAIGLGATVGESGLALAASLKSTEGNVFRPISLRSTMPTTTKPPRIAITAKASGMTSDVPYWRAGSEQVCGVRADFRHV